MMAVARGTDPFIIKPVHLLYLTLDWVTSRIASFDSDRLFCWMARAPCELDQTVHVL